MGGKSFWFYLRLPYGAEPLKAKGQESGTQPRWRPPASAAVLPVDRRRKSRRAVVLTLSRQWFIERIPVVRGGDARFDFVDQRAAIVPVRKDCHPISFADVPENVTPESPV